MKKVYTAKEFHLAPAIVYREADRNGFAQIKHDRYPGIIFALTAITVKGKPTVSDKEVKNGHK